MEPTMELQFENTKVFKDKKVNIISKLFGKSKESKEVIENFKSMIRVLPQEFSLEKLRNI